MIFDSHVHSYFSADCRSRPQDLLQEAGKKGMGLILTDHYDVHDYCDYPMSFDPEGYFRELSKHRRDSLLLGVEVSFREEGTDCLRALIAKYPFDFVMGSLHFPFRARHDRDFAEMDFFHHDDLLEAQYYYFEELLVGLSNYDFIHALGHIDYPTRYGSAFGRQILVKENREILEEIFTMMKERGVALELNTRMLSKDFAVENWRSILQFYRDCGAKRIVIGSDAHRVEALGRNFDLAMQLVEEAKLTAGYYREGEFTAMKKDA